MFGWQVWLCRLNGWFQVQGRGQVIGGSMPSVRRLVAKAGGGGRAWPLMGRAGSVVQWEDQQARQRLSVHRGICRLNRLDAGLAVPNLTLFTYSYVSGTFAKRRGDERD